MMTTTRRATLKAANAKAVNMTLKLECFDDELSDAQLSARNKYKENYDRVKETIEDLMKERGAKLISQAGNVSAYEYKLANAPPATLVKSNQLNLNQSKSQPIKLNVLNNTTGNQNKTPLSLNQGNIQLVMDPRMGVLLGAVTQSSTPTSNTNQVVSTSSTAVDNNRLNRRKVIQVASPEIIEESPAVSTAPAPVSATRFVSAQMTNPASTMASRMRTKQPATSNYNTTPSVANNSTASSSSKTNTRQVGSTITNLTTKPTEQTSIGGIAVGCKNAIGDTIDDSKRNLPDGREVAFNKMSGGRTFPSLVVVARPHICNKDVQPQVASKERSELDTRVKSVLMYSTTKFAEWLIQQGLVKAEQYCTQHPESSQMVNKHKLKLGMYSDIGTFPYSGGYVWLASCCPDRYVSVFCGSIFQEAPHPPSVLLKLIYHWSCQTNVQNVISWVKVTNIYVKNFYTNLRSICTAAIWDKCPKMGGKNISIQVGVISLGTTSQDGNLRQVKVEVLGILNAQTGQLRLRACDPIQETDRSFKRRFSNILSPLEQWVNKDSKIITDYTVDKVTLQEMGFNNIIQSSLSDQSNRNSRSNFLIMEYLRKIVPRMFQNTLSLLSRQLIQQFLDELVWREMFGATAARTFNNIILHIAEQTRIRSNLPLIERLAKISANPFANWSYSEVGYNLELPSSNSEPVQTKETIEVKKSEPARRKRRRAAVAAASNFESDSKRFLFDNRTKDIDKKDQVPLEEFYYATVPGDSSLILKEDKRPVHFACFLCTYTMKSNTEVMLHMVSHVPPRVPGQTVAYRRDSYVCRYCCAGFSTRHQLMTHVDETHSSFGKSDGQMLVCGICEQKFGNSILLSNHMSYIHVPSEMPYRCETCGYRTSSHKNIIDHYYKEHDMGEGLQCPYCLKVFQFNIDGYANSSNVHAYLVHMQRHVVRRDQKKGNKCPKCCLWFNQKSALQRHQKELHALYTVSDMQPYVGGDKSVFVSKSNHQIKRLMIQSPPPELPDQEDKWKKWNTGPITVNAPMSHLRCQECEEDIDELEHYPGEQKCKRCRYVTCCWRAFKEHQQQIHNERPMTSLIVPSPLLNIPLEKRMKCRCGFATRDGNLLATHLVKCNKVSARPVESGMLDSLGLMPKNNRN